MAKEEPRTYTLEEAAAIVQIDEHEVEWAIEEYGYCQVADAIIRPAQEFRRYTIRYEGDESAWHQ